MARKKGSGPPFVMLEKSVLKSAAWEALSHTEMIAYIHLKANYNGANNGEISFPYSSMKGVMASKTLSNALKRLIEKGWIEKTEFGGMHRYFCLYKLTGNYDIIR